MSSVSALVESNKAIFQECLLAQDPRDHLKTLPDSVEKKLLMFLTQPHSEDFQNELKKTYSLNEQLIQQLNIWKVQSKIFEAQNIDDIQYIVQKIQKEYGQQINCPKPAQFQSVTGEGKSEQSKLPSELQPIPQLNKWAVDQLNKKEENIKNFTQAAISSLSQTILLKLKPANKEILLKMPHVLRSFPEKFVTSFVKSFYQAMKQTNKNYQINSTIYSNLTKSSFMALKDEIKGLVNQNQYLKVWVSYNYEEQLQKYVGRSLTLSEKNEKKKMLENVLIELTKLNTSKTKPIEKAVLRELLILDISMQEVDKNLFLKYYEDNPTTNSYENQIKKKEKQQQQLQLYHQSHTQPNLRVNVQSVSMSEDALIKQIIQRLFKTNDAEKILKQLEQYFETSWLNKLFATTQLSEGGKVDDFSKYFQVNQLKQFKQLKEITILDKDQKRWKAEDQIILQVRVKNVSCIHVKVYKLDLQKHYVQHNTEIDPTQDISYLHPNYCYQYKIAKNNPYLIQTIEIKIDGIPHQRGVWIVDLEGKGIQSRALIRKGAIAMMTSTKTQGTELKFYDQNGIQVNKYTVWMEGKSHFVQSNFVIPFGENNKNLSLVVSKDGYSERFDIFVPSQEYSLNIAYIYNNESFIVGKMAKLLLHPHLSLKFNPNMQISFKLLQKLRIMVTLTNNLGIKSNVEIANPKFKENEDYLVEFPIQSYTKKIQIQVSAKITKYNKKEEILTNNHSIQIQLGQHHTNFIDLYMRKKHSNYELFILGKNGQPIPKTELTIKYFAFGRNREETQLLITGSDGSVNLGSLKNILSINATVNLKTSTLTRSWNLQQFESQIQYVDNAVYMQDDKIQYLRLPNEKVNLWKLTDIGGVFCQQLINQINEDDNKVVIETLNIGRYCLQFLTSGKKVNFTVVQGKKWQNENKIFDEKKSLLYELSPHQNDYISLGQATFTENDQLITVSIPLEGTYDFNEDETLRGHLLVSNFILPNFEGKLTLNSNLLRRQRLVKFQNFNTKKSQYYNNKQLGQQISYTLNRINQKKHVGNDLEKPKIFLKRLEVGETTQLEEMLQPQAPYHYPYVQQQIAPQLGSCYATTNTTNMPYPCAPALPKAMHMCRSTRKQQSKLQLSVLTRPESLSSFNNFLVLPGTILPNKKGDTLTFEVPNGYSHFECFLFTKANSIIKKYDYEEVDEVKIKNLGHTGIKQGKAGTAWTMSRQVYKAKKGQVFKVGRDSTWSAIGLTNLVNFAKIKGANLQDWVTNWNSYSADQKRRIYDDKLCHELNTYIKYNDPKFFKETVKPFISNKITKTFVDLCLLDHPEALKYTEINLFKTLNQFQKVLLAQQLANKNQMEQVSNIVASMENTNKSKRISSDQFKKQFDTVISAKLVQEAAKSLTANKTQTKIYQQKSMSRAQANKNKCESLDMLQQECQQQSSGAEYQMRANGMSGARDRFVQPFKQMEQTKQYTQTTYSKLKQSHKTTDLIGPSPFWTSVANYFIKPTHDDFLSENFMYLTTPVQFTLASCFIPNEKQLKFQLNTLNHEVSIQPASSFLIFVKELKSFEFGKKFGVLLNQRFFNPDDRYYYEEDGTQIEKQAQQFVVRRPYCIQTLITNTSGTQLQLQLLIDIPEGSLPLRGHQATKIQSINLKPYSTLSFQRYFYFPKVGEFTLYPANACRGNSVIAKAQKITNISVLEVQTIKKMDTLQNVLKSGNKQQILNYLQTKNIFDLKIFQPTFIRWMLKEKSFYNSVLKILRKRKFYSQEIWIFAYLHEDLEAIKQHNKIYQTIHIEPQQNLNNIQTFQYFPYFSRRTHKFLNQNKNTIRNQQFKKTYFNFLFTTFFNNPTSSRSRICFIYFLLLQDRVDEAYQLFIKLNDYDKDDHRLQFDYIQCFIDMYKGYPSFTKARKIVVKYRQYPVKSWQKLFKAIDDTLKEYDSEEIAEEVKEQFKTKVVKGANLKITVPPQTKVYVYIFNINLQLYFSAAPFSQNENFESNIISNFIQQFEAGQHRDEKIQRSIKMKDCFVQIYESVSGLKKKKVQSFYWNNPEIKVKIKQEKGEAQVFVDNKRKPGCYCKVFQMRNGQSKFCRDGYTDITGNFKYALTDLKGITQFAILFVTERGSLIERVRPPSEQGFFI